MTEIHHLDTHAARTEQTRSVVRNYVAALQRGDLATLRACFAPDATWSLRGDLPVSGTWTGPEQILDVNTAHAQRVLVADATERR